MKYNPREKSWQWPEPRIVQEKPTGDQISLVINDFSVIWWEELFVKRILVIIIVITKWFCISRPLLSINNNINTLVRMKRLYQASRNVNNIW